MLKPYRDDNLKIPGFIYGTAWKEDKTAFLTELALQAGFVGIDTANQRKHYYEAGVGEGLHAFLAKSDKKREDLFIQSKFTYEAGQDHRLPYDPEETFSKQIRQSFASSLKHLQIDYLDSYLLHAPEKTHGISDADLEVWQTMENLHKENKIRFLGISNASQNQLKTLYEKVNVKPHFIQNRCFAFNGWDKEVREYCKKMGILYQGFSLLTANELHLMNKKIDALMQKYEKTRAQITFRFALEIDILPLTGTTNEKHMNHDLNIDNFSLTDQEIKAIEDIAIFSE